jgi:CheY-like chemotaxis protein
MVARPSDLDFEPSVLITDDSDSWREALGEVLHREGFRTLEAACGEEAIELVRTEHLDLALIDFHMPRLDGLETIREIRRHDARLPAVLMTAHPGALPYAQVRELHVTTVLVKTADREGIVTVVLGLVRRHG